MFSILEAEDRRDSVPLNAEILHLFIFFPISEIKRSDLRFRAARDSTAVRVSITRVRGYSCVNRGAAGLCTGRMRKNDRPSFFTGAMIYFHARVFAFDDRFLSFPVGISVSNMECVCLARCM